MAIEYNFKYMPLVGKLSGESMIKQTETAINEIAQIVNENTAQAEIINTLAETANSNSVEALEKANEALETSSRVYITETLAVDLDNYCESQLIYINNAFSQNLPVAHKGFLEVKTNDDKTQATQVFADDVDKKFYVRTGAITESIVGDVTTYTASYGEWTNIPNSTDLANYLPVAGGTMSGDIEFSASEFAIKGNDIANDGEISVVGATDNLNGASLNLYGRNHTESGAFELNANNGTLTKTLKGDANGNLQWNNNNVITSAGGTMTGPIVLDTTGLASRSINNSFLQINGGTEQTNGAWLRLNGKDNTGNFQIQANDGTNSKALVGRPTGNLTWDGNNVITSAGGTLTGALNTANNTWNDLGDDASFGDHNVAGKMCVKTQTSTATGIAFFNSSNTNVGQVEVNNAFNFNKTIQQNGTDVSLSTHTHSYLPLSGGTMTGSIKRNGDAVVGTANDAYTRVCGGGGIDNGAAITLGGMSHSWAGHWEIKAYNGTTVQYLIGKHDGTLTWGGKNVERVDTNGSNYIRFVSGLQICWFGITVNSTEATFTFPASFTSTNVQVVGTPRARIGLRIDSITNTNFKAQTDSTTSYNVHILAIGKWK